MRKDLLDVFKEAMKYHSQITENLMVVTNYTILFKTDLLDYFEKNKEEIKIVLSDYGNRLSSKFDKNKKLLEERSIPHRISNSSRDELYYDGWLDFTDHSLKWTNKKARDKNASKCIHRTGKYFIINEGKIHCCSRSFWRAKNNIIPRVKGEFVPLLDNTVSIEEKRANLRTIMLLSSSGDTACAMCPGFNNETPRHYPAEQLQRSRSK